MIVAVTGGRDVQPSRVELAALARALEACRCTTLRHGDARGVDRAVAAYVADVRPGVMLEAWPARWRLPDDVVDRGAGPRRSAAMLRGDTHDASVTWARASLPLRPRAVTLIAWPGGPGTRGCCAYARKLGVQVIDIEALVVGMRGAS